MESVLSFIPGSSLTVIIKGTQKQSGLNTFDFLLANSQGYNLHIFFKTSKIITKNYLLSTQVLCSRTVLLR